MGVLDVLPAIALCFDMANPPRNRVEFYCDWLSRLPLEVSMDVTQKTSQLIQCGACWVYQEVESPCTVGVVR